MKRELLALTTTVSLLLTGCSTPAPTPVETAIPVATSEAPVEQVGFTLPCYPAGGFHPITGTNRLNLTLSPLLYRGLFSLDRQFRAQNDLCLDYTVSEDGLVWSFWLTAVDFSDGFPLTAAEVVTSLNAARTSERYRDRLRDIVKVAAEGETVVVTLAKPNGALPALLDVPIVKETEDKDRPLGTGMYFLAGTGEELSLRARVGSDTSLEEIPLRSVGASDDLIYAFDAGEISLVDTDLTSTNALGYSGRFETTDYPTTALLYLGCNTKKGACKDEAVRLAVSRAADRAGMVRRLFSGHAVAACLPIHPAAEGYDADVAEGLGYDHPAAAELLKQGGWMPDETGMLQKGRDRLELKLVVNQDNTYKVKTAETLAEELTGLGCAVTVEKLAWDDFTTALKKGDFDLYLGETVLTADFDPEPLLFGTLNYGGFADTETAKLLTAYQAAAGEERTSAAAKLWERLAQQCPIVPLCFKNGSLLTQWGQVSGAKPTQRDVFAGLSQWRVGS